MSAENVYKNFYRIRRLGAAELSDGGGPFGFDITTALEFDYLIDRYQETYFVIDSFAHLMRETAPDFTPIYARLRSRLAA